MAKAYCAKGAGGKGTEFEAGYVEVMRKMRRLLMKLS